MMALLGSLLVAVVYVGGSSELLRQMMAQPSGQELGAHMVELARQSLGRPYRSFSLDTGPEQLQIDLTAFDCFLFVEQLLALARESTRSAFEDRVRHLRYRGGFVDYCHRQHYFSLWSQQAEASNVLRDITPELPGAQRRQRQLNYMSTHSSSYRPLRNKRNLLCIQTLEKNLIVHQSYIPLERLPSVEPMLRDGDIFALVTSVPGLDVTHVGLVEREQNRVHGLHAAPRGGVVRSRDLNRYASGVADVIGVSFHRPLKP